MTNETALSNNIVQTFRAEFAPTASILYVDDTAASEAYYDTEQLARLHLPVMPASSDSSSVVLYDEIRQWLFLIETVPAHGPITPARRQQLAEWAQHCPAHKVFVTAFPDMPTYQALGEDIAWHTEVWLADAPQHLIHFNGDRFMGPR